MLHLGELPRLPTANWSSIAALLADTVTHPVFVIAADGTLVLVNHGAEVTFGRDRDDLVGRPFERVVPEDARARFELLRQAASTGARRAGDVIVATPAGVRLVLTLRLSPVAEREERSLVCEVTETRVETTAPAWADEWLLIRCDEPFGEITAAHDSRSPDLVGRRCHEVVAGLAEVCPGCPVLQLSADGVAVDLHVMPDKRVMLRRAHRVTAHTAHVTHTMLPPASLAAAFSTRLRLLAQRSGLSEREEEVLGELVAGRAQEEIAELLQISPRTVRFHQANVFGKLGIESRHDLLRLLLD